MRSYASGDILCLNITLLYNILDVKCSILYPLNGGYPCNISYKNTPKPHISTL